MPSPGRACSRYGRSRGSEGLGACVRPGWMIAVFVFHDAKNRPAVVAPAVTSTQIPRAVRGAGEGGTGGAGAAGGGGVGAATGGGAGGAGWVATTSGRAPGTSAATGAE